MREAIDETPSVAARGRSGGLTLPTRQLGSLRPVGMALLKVTPGISSQDDNPLPDSRHMGFSLGPAAWEQEEPVGICSLSLSPHPLIIRSGLFIWCDSSEASLGQLPLARLPCSLTSLNHGDTVWS